MTTVGHRVFVIGGANRTITSDVFSYRFHADRWVNIGSNGDLKPLFGHSAVNFNDNSIIVFGGETHYNKEYRIRECVNTVMKFSVPTSKWT